MLLFDMQFKAIFANSWITKIEDFTVVIITTEQIVVGRPL